MAKRIKCEEEEPYIMDAATSRRIKKKFKELVNRLEIMALDVESVRTVSRQKFTKVRKEKERLRSKEGYDYLPISMRIEIENAIIEHIAEQRAKLIARRLIEAQKQRQLSSLGLTQMIVVNGASRTRTEFPILDEHPELEHEEALQASDLYYIIGMNEIPDKNPNPKNGRLYDVEIHAIKKKTFNVIQRISKRYKNEFQQVVMKGPKINGKQSYIYHESILRLAAKYMEEEALQKMLCPPRGKTAENKGRSIIEEWNRLKDDLLKDNSAEAERLKESLAKLGFFDGHLDYTKNGARRKAPQEQSREDEQER